ncbi:MAG: alpha-L-rhamnosidase [Bacteroidetes bacterium]|nr:MAG: alpha-L-rhamnosidase [Bacteroidota bacterium]
MKKTFLILLVLNRSLLFAASPLQVDRLKTEYLENPISIAEQHPRFSWTFSSTVRNQFQSAYEIIVSTSLDQINRGIGDVLTTGKVSSSKNINVEYRGKSLLAFTRYYWRVKVYNAEDKGSAWSIVAWFETAMLNANDWSANWINDGIKNPIRDEDYYKADRMPLFRKEFRISKKIGAARLYISGVGYYEAYLNGKKIGDRVLEPGFTTYRKEVLYSVYDITSMLHAGNNFAGVMLGSGWWNPLPLRLFGRWDLREVQQTGRPCVKAEIHIRYTDGTTDKIVTNDSWKSAAGPIIHNSVYLGESYDARLEQKNWNADNAEKTEWKNAVVADGPSGELTPQMQPPVRVTKIVRPVKITEVGKDTFLVDFGQNFAGVARIRVKGNTGRKISLRYGEDIFEDGRLNYLTTCVTQIKKGVINGGPGAPETAWQEDDYILKGDGVEEWSPRFTFHGFRYIEVTGWPGKPGLNDIAGLRMNSDVQQVGNFVCSNDDFNRLHEVIQWTFLSNIFSVQSDCPGREKMGYGGDMVATCQAFMYNYDMSQFYRKTVRDFANEQRSEGGITEIAPYTGIADRGYGDDSGPLGWELAFAYLQQNLYQYYGDKNIIASYYEAFKKQLDFLQSKALQGLFFWDISDHEALDPRPEAFTAAAFYFHHAKLAEAFAGILGNKEDSIKYNKLAGQIKQNIIRRYFVPTTGRFDNATQSAQIFALWYGLTPEKDLSWEVLMEEFKRHDWHVATGIFSTKMMFDLFRENDANDTAYKIASQPDFPGWLNMIHHGATTLWETWAYPEAFPSQNHPMFGAIDEWFYRSLLGINSETPAFEKIIIKPQPVKGVSWAKGSYESVRGTILSEWKKQGSGFTLHVVIPPNTTATIYVPSKNKLEVVGSKSDVKFEKGYTIIVLGSGDYFFNSDLDAM